MIQSSPRNGYSFTDATSNVYQRSKEIESRPMMAPKVSIWSLKVHQKAMSFDAFFAELAEGIARFLLGNICLQLPEFSQLVVVCIPKCRWFHQARGSVHTCGPRSQQDHHTRRTSSTAKDVVFFHFFSNEMTCFIIIHDWKSL